MAHAIWISSPPATFWSAASACSCSRRRRLGGSIIFIGSKNALAASPGRRGLLHRQGLRIASGALPGAGVAPAGHPRQCRQSRCGAARFAHLAGRMGRAARRASTRPRTDELEAVYRERSLLKRSVLPGGRRRGRGLFCLRALGQVAPGNIINVDAGNAAAFTALTSDRARSGK